MLPQLITEAKWQAEKLGDYRILPGHHGVFLWVHRGQWLIVQPFSDRETAEDYLFAKLPVIAS